MHTLILIVLILLVVGLLPTWPYSRQWGAAPGGLAGAILVVFVVLWLLGVLRF